MNEKEVKEFLERETPQDGGCMLCLVTYKYMKYDLEKRCDVEKDVKDYFLIERHNISNGFLFTINTRMHEDYRFVWADGNENHWEILYKKEK
jgi:hypothetical protein